jgi:YidC/Oxa1 family membrane protein insertase
MTPWTMWLDTIRALLDGLSFGAGLGLGFAIIVTTLLLRVALLPISWPVAYRSCVRQKKVMRLQPELKRLRDRHADDLSTYAEKMAALYRKHELTLFDGRSVLGALAQMPVFLGMFHVLRNVGEGVRFLWVQNLLGPDTLFAIIAGVSTAMMSIVNPDIPEQMRMIMIVVPGVLAILFALKFSSALALYWSTSNCFSALQTVVVHWVIGRRLGAGRLET